MEDLFFSKKTKEVKKKVAKPASKITENNNKKQINIKGTLYDEELCAIDTYTNEYNLKEKLTPYADFSSNLKFSSKTSSIVYRNKTITLCDSLLKDYNKELFYLESSKKYYFLNENKNNLNVKKYSPSNKIYSLEDSPYKINKYETLENDLNFLKDYTFGIELETSGSIIQELDAIKLGFATLYDGSINGPEFVSGVMKYNNFHFLASFLDVIKRFSLINDQCSLHFHIGNIEYTPKNLFSLYNLFQRLQDELFLLVAPYKRDFMFLANKGKDHCKGLPRLPVDDINELYELLGVTRLVNSEEEKKQFLYNKKKWDILGRYFSVNFINFICKPTQNKTVEIRSLQMTYNLDYILTWLFANMSVINYALKYPDIVLERKKKIVLKDCIEEFIPVKFVKTLLTNIKNLSKFFHNAYHINRNNLQNLENLEIEINRVVQSYGIFEKVTSNTLFNKIPKINDSAVLEYTMANRKTNGNSFYSYSTPIPLTTIRSINSYLEKYDFARRIEISRLIAKEIVLLNDNWGTNYSDYDMNFNRRTGQSLNYSPRISNVGDGVLIGYRDCYVKLPQISDEEYLLHTKTLNNLDTIPSMYIKEALHNVYLKNLDLDEFAMIGLGMFDIKVQRKSQYLFLINDSVLLEYKNNSEVLSKIEIDELTLISNLKFSRASLIEGRDF